MMRGHTIVKIRRWHENIAIRAVVAILVVVGIVLFMMDHADRSRPSKVSFRGKLSGHTGNTNSVLNSQIDHAIIVAGHAVVKLGLLNIADKEDSAWHLLAYQLNQGFPDIISSHIHAGISALASDKNSILIFSGGQTRRDVGPLSEAASYYYFAKEMTWLNGIQNKVYLEEFAKDSYENLLFSICRFNEVVGHYPKRISVIGFDFKRKRFEEIHLRAISFSPVNFTYIGIRPKIPFDHSKALTGEAQVLDSYAQDIYGCGTPALSHKREARNPFMRTTPYELSCPELRALLQWCGLGMFSGNLPWRNNNDP